ncbi:MAG: DNA methyltransferase [Candidatus Cloacimonetes bacterium]|nr:DNA methyltransferase [Candidatus Cloacimonadota bacterium]
MINLSTIASITDLIFGDTVELLPGVNDIFELELAYLEKTLLDSEKLLERTAYIKTIDGRPSKHYLQNFKSEQQHNFDYDNDESNYATAYASHGLFPYRGKFHPQLVKALINIAGVNKGDIILDPMAGSGTTNIEASLMGIESYAIDISPFCRFMIQTKYDALSIKLHMLEYLPTKDKMLFNYFSRGDVLTRICDNTDVEKRKVYNLAFLAFLDAMGYSKRVKTQNHEMLFRRVLDKYYNQVKDMHSNMYYSDADIGSMRILPDSDALDIRLPDSSVDCVLTSPPYSFAIDYIENDKDQLEFLGYDIKELKTRLIGLKGKSREEKLKQYQIDMDYVCKEISRVLKAGKYFIVIIGSNTKQTGGVRLERFIIESAKKYKLDLIKCMLKPIRGMRNTMKDEYILMFKKGV